MTDYLTTADVAADLGVDVVTVNRWVADPDVPLTPVFKTTGIRGAHLFTTHALAGLRAALPERSRRTAVFVYFIQSGDDGPIKIGSASNPAARVKGLQSGNPVTLRLLAVEPGDARSEHALHRRFASDRIRGEWFRPSAALLARIPRETASAA